MSKTSSYCQALSEAGFRLLPLAEARKTPLTRNGVKDASSDRKVIQGWLNKWPRMGLGIATGKPSGVIVIDIDIKDERNGLESLYQEFGEVIEDTLENTWLVETPSGGLHMYFNYPDGMVVRNRVNILPGVDVRGDNGYVVAPPTRLPIKGKDVPYKFIHNAVTDISDPPDWAIELLTGKTKCGQPKRSGLDLPTVIAGISEGDRDNQLFRFAGWMHNKKIPHQLALAFMKTAASFCQPPFDEYIAIEKVDRLYAQKGGN